MKLNAVAVSSRNLKESIKFYSIIGFTFPEIQDDEKHVEAQTETGVKLMLDSHSLMKELLEKDPIPANHSSFAIEFESAEEIDEIVEKLKTSGFTIYKEPWDAFWGQHYAVVQDPDGYLVDLYSKN